MLTDVTAFAPGTVANVGIGFDILGHTVEAVGDRVRLRRIPEPIVRIASISGIAALRSPFSSTTDASSLSARAVPSFASP